MTYFGKPDEGKVVEPLRRFTYKTWGGKETSVDADGVAFGPGHVQFWRNNPDGGSSILVLAETNANVNHLQEEAR